MFIRRSIYYDFVKVVFLLLIFIVFNQKTLWQSLRPDLYFPQHKVSTKTYRNPPNDSFTRCLLQADKALRPLSLRWVLVFGSALMYHRSNNFVSDDIDVGIFHDDLVWKNITERALIAAMRRARFKLLVRYGTMNDGQGWTLQCPQSSVHFGIFVFYQIDFRTETKNAYSWWTASYNGPCAQTPCKKCRRGFSKFELENFRMYGQVLDVVSKQFLIDQYGADWRTPQKYSYVESIRMMPNLLEKPRNSSSLQKKGVKLKRLPRGRRDSR